MADQNRAYAVSQLNDLAAKVQKAQSSVATRAGGAAAANLGSVTKSKGEFIDLTEGGDAVDKQSQASKEPSKKEAGSGKKKEKEKEETAMEKVVKDRYVYSFALST